MDTDQIIKRIDWLEEERRKDKSTIAALEERLVVLEGSLDAKEQQLKDQSGEITRIGAVLGRVDQFNSDLAQHRLEINRMIDEVEKHRSEREREIEEFTRVQLEGVNNHIVTLRTGLDTITKLEGSLQVRVEEDYRLNRLIDELQEKIQDLGRQEEERNRSQRLLEESHRRDAKRLTDLQGEVVSLRKRLDEQRGKIDLSGDNIKKVESRVNELAAVQAERMDTQAAYMEKISLKEVERDRLWKTWETRFTAIEERSVEIDIQLQGLDEARRSVARAQETLETMTERMERRINEITEMQRISEERFRQDWVTFKADDQKRWTNYTLNQEEQYRESKRQMDELKDQIARNEDQLHSLRDMLDRIDDQTEKRLQKLLSITREWVAEYERALGRAR